MPQYWQACISKVCAKHISTHQLERVALTEEQCWENLIYAQPAEFEDDIVPPVTKAAKVLPPTVEPTIHKDPNIRFWKMMTWHVAGSKYTGQDILSHVTNTNHQWPMVRTELKWAGTPIANALRATHNVHSTKVGVKNVTLKRDRTEIGVRAGLAIALNKPFGHASNCNTFTPEHLQGCYLQIEQQLPGNQTLIIMGVYSP